MVYVALLRGINVGGNNKVEMSRLKMLFEQLGFGDVKTYINSGNIIFRHNGTETKSQLLKSIEAAIEHEFQLNIKVVLQDQKTILTIAKAVPVAWVNADGMKCDVFLLNERIDSEGTLQQFIINPAIEDMTYVPGAIIWRIDRKDFGKSKIPNMMGTELYRNMTLRNVNTLRKLAEIIAAYH